MDAMTFNIAGAAGLKISISEQADGSLRFDLVNEGDQVADLRGLFFDVNDASLLKSLSVTGSDVTKTAAGDNSVVNLGSGVTMQGVDSFDFGVAFGTSGIGKDDIHATSFTLRSSSGALDLDDFYGVDFGVRFTSVGDLGGSREGSLKLTGSAPDLDGEGPIILPPIEFPPFDFPPGM